MIRKNNRMTRKQWILLLLTVAALLVLLLAFRGNVMTEEESPKSATTSEKEPSISELVDAVKSLKGDLKKVLKDIKKGDLESARKRSGTISEYILNLKKAVDRAQTLLGSLAPGKLAQIRELLDAADMAMDEILVPAIDLMDTCPLSQMKVGDGFDTRIIGRYLDFAESVMPRVEELLEQVNAIDLSLIDSDGEITGYLNLANKLLNFYREDPEVFSVLRSILGTEEDRLYLIAVQNSAEIRASGGFPGSMGTVRISDGILTLGDFQSVTYVLSSFTPQGIQITAEERELFGFLSGIQTPRDADLCPDFERVGHIWALGYEQMNKEPVDGVISVTPHIVQRLLAATGETIELFDGLELNGENAMQVLQHDIYYKYFGREYVQGRGEISDQLFADAAKKTMKLLTSEVNVSRLLSYMPILKESVADRTLMLWMKEDAQQNLVARLGCSGGLNKDPEKPEAGVYFNCITPSKMGWFLKMDIEIGERTRNHEGAWEYPVTVTVTNTVTEEEVRTAASYISGGMSGAFQGAAYFIAPAGGTVRNFTASNSQTIREKNYNGLELGFMDAFLLRPNQPITVTYTLTTAPGVDTPPEISRTPTAQ